MSYILFIKKSEPQLILEDKMRSTYTDLFPVIDDFEKICFGFQKHSLNCIHLVSSLAPNLSQTGRKLLGLSPVHIFKQVKNQSISLLEEKLAELNCTDFLQQLEQDFNQYHILVVGGNFKIEYLSERFKEAMANIRSQFAFDYHLADMNEQTFQTIQVG